MKIEVIGSKYDISVETRKNYTEVFIGKYFIYTTAGEDHLAKALNEKNMRKCIAEADKLKELEEAVV